MSPRDAESIFVSNLATVERIIASIARRHNIQGDDADDFASWVKLRLIDNDYAVLRKFEGRSAVTTYLTVVISNLFRDYRIKEWGRWRPSVAARRLGPLATRLEQLIARDRLTAEEACSTVQCALPELDPAVLRRLASALPMRERRARASAAELEYAPAREQSDAHTWAALADQERDHTEAALQRALSTLPAEDQLILRMRFWEGLTIAAIARCLGLEQKPLYRRIEKDLVVLRQALQHSGVSRELVAELVGVE